MYNVAGYGELKEQFNKGISAYIDDRKEVAGAKDTNGISRAHQVNLLQAAAQEIDVSSLTAEEKSFAFLGLLTVFTAILHEEYRWNKGLKGKIDTVISHNNEGQKPSATQELEWLKILNGLLNQVCFKNANPTEGLIPDCTLNTIDGVGVSKDHQGTKLQDFLKKASDMELDRAISELSASHEAVSKGRTAAFSKAYSEAIKSKGESNHAGVLGTLFGGSKATSSAATPAAPTAPTGPQ